MITVAGIVVAAVAGDDSLEDSGSCFFFLSSLQQNANKEVSSS